MKPFPLPRAFARAAGAAALSLLLAVPALAAGAVQRVTSPGGITAWLVTDETVPLVAVDFAFRGGASQDPAGKPGVANLLSTLLDEGAGDLDSAAFQLKLDETAVRVGFSADHDSFSGSMATLSTRKEVAFDLLAQALTKPRFDPEPIERMRAAIVAQLKSRRPTRITSPRCCSPPTPSPTTLTAGRTTGRPRRWRPSRATTWCAFTARSWRGTTS